MPTRSRLISILSILAAGLGLSIIMSLTSGVVDVGVADLIGILSGGGEPMSREIILKLRLPRIILAAIVGAALSVSGGVFQGIFRNQLADPYVLGISSGAALGAAIAILSPFHHPWLTPIASFLGSLATLAMIYPVGRIGGRIYLTALLLAGVMVGLFLSAILWLLLSLSPREKLGDVIFWLMGNLGLASYQRILPVLLYVTMSMVTVLSMARGLNAMNMGEDEARQLGIDTERLKRRSLIAASLMTGAVVSVSGVIGFVGLIIPAGLRVVIGNDARLILPASALLGATFLILSDTLARVLLAPVELPIGIVTSLVGAPVFIYLLRKIRWSV